MASDWEKFSTMFVGMGERFCWVKLGFRHWRSKKTGMLVGMIGVFFLFLFLVASICMCAIIPLHVSDNFSPVSMQTKL